MEQHSIREATSEDASLVAGLIRESFRDVAVRFSLSPENCPKHPSNCATSWVETDQARGVQYFIVSRQDEPAGCVALEQRADGVVFLERLAVLPQHRRHGLGRSLVDCVISHAATQGARRLSAAIIAEHTDLKDWYLRMGFVERETKTFPHLPFSVTFLEFAIDRSANNGFQPSVAGAPQAEP